MDGINTRPRMGAPRTRSRHAWNTVFEHPALLIKRCPHCGRLKLETLGPLYFERASLDLDELIFSLRAGRCRELTQLPLHPLREQS